MSRGLGSTQRRALVDLYMATMLCTPLYAQRFTIAEIHTDAMVSVLDNSTRAAYRRALRALSAHELVECAMDTVDVRPARRMRSELFKPFLGIEFAPEHLARFGGSEPLEPLTKSKVRTIEVLTVSLTARGLRYVDERRDALGREFGSFRLLLDPSAFDGRAKAVAAVALYCLTYRQVVEPILCPNGHRPATWFEHWMVAPGRFHHSFTCPHCGCSVFWPEIADPPHPFRAVIAGSRRLPRVGRVLLGFVGPPQMSAVHRERPRYRFW